MSLGKKIEELRKKRGLNQASLAKLIGVSRSAIGQYESDANGPSPEVALKMAEVLGVGLEVLENARKEKGQERIVSSSELLVNGLRTNGGVPYYDVDISALNVESLINGPQKPAGFLIIPGAEDCDFSCKVSGNSMYDKILPGAIIACKEIKDRELIGFGSIHLVITSEQRWLRIVRKHQKDGWLRLESHNKGYDAIDCSLSKINRLFLVKLIVNQEEM